MFIKASGWVIDIKELENIDFFLLPGEIKRARICTRMPVYQDSVFLKINACYLDII